MELLKPVLHEIIKSSSSTNPLFIRNRLKEYLQIIVLDYLYTHPSSQNLIFYGGSALALCHGLPRLSEDLDFIDAYAQIDLDILKEKISTYFNKSTDIPIKATIQKFRIYLKFPILKELGLSSPSETDDLFLKLEIYKDISFCKSYETIIIPLFKYNRSILIKSFNLSTMMATKIRAVLYRKWEKTNKEGVITVFSKGRDYFDLMWFFEKNIIPTMECMENFTSQKELYEALLSILDKIDPTSFQLDLESFIENKEFVKSLSNSVNSILHRQIMERLSHLDQIEAK